MDEACIYNTGARDPCTGRVQKATEGDSVPQEATSYEREAPDVTNQRLRLNQDSQRRRGVSDSWDTHGTTGSDETLETLLKETIHALPSDYFSVQRGSRFRYISKTFWGFMNGNVR